MRIPRPTTTNAPNAKHKTNKTAPPMSSQFGALPFGFSVTDFSAASFFAFTEGAAGGAFTVAVADGCTTTVGLGSTGGGTGMEAVSAAEDEPISARRVAAPGSCPLTA